MRGVAVGIAVMKTIEDKNRFTESEYIILEGVPWKTYEGILDALGGVSPAPHV